GAGGAGREERGHGGGDLLPGRLTVRRPRLRGGRDRVSPRPVVERMPGERGAGSETDADADRDRVTEEGKPPLRRGRHKSLRLDRAGIPIRARAAREPGQHLFGARPILPFAGCEIEEIAPRANLYGHGFFPLRSY